MGAAEFTLAIVPFTASIFFASAGCGSLPTSKQELESFYHSTEVCKISGERIFSQNRLLVYCNGDSANISILEKEENIIYLVARCTLDGMCIEKNHPLPYGQSSEVFPLPENSTDCFFGACHYGDTDYDLVYVNLSKCAVDPVSTAEVTEYTTAAPTNYYSTAPQPTTDAVDPVNSINTSNSTISQTTGRLPDRHSTSTNAVDPVNSINTSNSTISQTTGRLPDRHSTSTKATISGVLMTIFVAVLLILVLVVVAVCKRSTPSLKDLVIFPSNNKFDMNFQPVTFDVGVEVSKSRESILLALYGHTDLHTPDELGANSPTSSRHYQQSNFSDTTLAKLQDEPLAQEEVYSEVTLSSVSLDFYQLEETHVSELKQCLPSGPSDLVTDGSGPFEAVKVDQGNIRNVQNTDNLSPATPTWKNVDFESEMLDEISNGGNILMELDSNRDIFNSGNSLKPPEDNYPTEHVQGDAASLFLEENMDDAPHFFTLQYTDENRTSSGYISSDSSSNHIHHPSTGFNYYTEYV